MNESTERVAIMACTTLLACVALATGHEGVAALVVVAALAVLAA